MATEAKQAPYDDGFDEYVLEMPEDVLGMSLDALDAVKRNSWIKQDRFLKAYAASRTKMRASGATGISRQTVHNWESTNLMNFRERLEGASESFCDNLEGLCLNRLRKQDHTANPTLLIFYMNGHMPHRYKTYSNMDDDTAKATFDFITKAAKKIAAQEPGPLVPEATAEDKVVSFIQRKSG